jgi:hypothetical protein
MITTGKSTPTTVIGTTGSDVEDIIAVIGAEDEGRL